MATALRVKFPTPRSESRDVYGGEGSASDTLPAGSNLEEDTMLGEDGVRVILARLARGEGVQRRAREPEGTNKPSGE